MPYGKHTGDDSVDTLTIVQHDKFQDIVDEANKPDSIIRVKHIIVIDDDEGNGRKEILTPQSRFKEEIEQRKSAIELLDGPNKEKEIINLKRDEFILPFLNTVVQKATSFTKEAITTGENIETFKNAYQAKLESEGHIFAKDEAIEAVGRYVTIAEEFIDNTIPIPRLVIQPSGNTRLIFRDFNLDTSKMNYQPGSEEIVTRELQSGNQRVIEAGKVNYKERYIENHLISVLMDKQEIWYDEHRELLYKLANQAVLHFKSYLADDREVVNVILNFKLPIADQIYQQMMDHHEIVHDGFERPIMTVRPYSEIKDPSISKNLGERIYDYKENIEPASQIRNKVFGGFVKAYHSINKFDSKTEKDFATILEQDKDCIKWLRPAKSQFQIYYGHPSKEYMPDFVIETPEFIALVETKKRDDVETEQVQSKAKAALNYCINATVYNEQTGGKPWKYILIPHDAVQVNMSLKHLCSQFEIKTS